MAEPSSSTQCEDIKLAIEYPSEIEKKQQNEMKNKDRHRPSVFAVVIKWLVTFIVGIILLACLTISKISILAISESMNQDQDLDSDSACRLFIQLQIMMLVPNIVNLIRSVWTGAFRKDLPMPSCKTILCAIPICLLESFGTCLFIFIIPGLTRVHHIVLLMNCVFIIPLIDNTIQSWRKRNDPHKKKWIALFVFGILLELVGISLTIYLLSLDTPTNKLWMPIVGMLALSLTWTPSVYRYLPENTKNSNSDADQEQENEHVDIDNSSIQQQENDSGGQINGERATWKLTIIMSIVKIISTFVISMLIFNVEYLAPFPANTSVTIADYSDGWKLSVWDDSRKQDVYYFTAHIISSLLSYFTGYMACTTCMQIGAFALPLVSTIIPSLILLTVPKTCETLLMRIDETQKYSGCTFAAQNISEVDTISIIAGGFLLLAQIIVTLRQIWKNGSLVKLRECQLFYLPMYTSVLLEQWLMLIRRSEFSDKDYFDRVSKTNRAKLIICTTMYRENEHEMKQLLESIHGIVQTKKKKHIESHIIFDDGTKGTEPKEYALQLLYLVEDVLKVKFNSDCTKRETPYGMSLKWTLNGTSNEDAVNSEENKMDLTIHLKDNTKVKSKKRWSQVMYMSYVLDILLKKFEAKDEDFFILTTDADVKFTPDSIAYLLDLMARDDSVGAVCARTFPLGSGPVVWYQAFEYAIGHWLQKAAEHVIGSVLCSPGCFSVYRCKAIREVIRTYQSDVEHAFDFLTKDMGEDRWLCTLMVQTGRRIEYCAASENSTHCPESFSEFFKQRRRWVVSTLANMMLLLQEWNKVHKYNHRISFVFLVYQAILLFATLIGPSSVILIVCGGLKYAWNWNPYTTLIWQVVLCICFIIVCLKTPSNTQINISKVLTFFYAAIMTAVMVGTAVELSLEFDAESGSKSNFISDKIKISTTAAYLYGLVGIFLLTGVLHLKECVYLLHGIWYLLCLPSGYLLLIIYSICNITDRSWGTREGKQESDYPFIYQYWFSHIKKRFFALCCNIPPEEFKTKEQQEDETNSDIENEGTEDTELESSSNEIDQLRLSGSSSFRRTETPVLVRDWLPHDMKKYANMFIQEGYENTIFISSMTDTELHKIGINADIDRTTLLSKIQKLPTFDIPPSVPSNLTTWLRDIGLKQYSSNFRDASFDTTDVIERLKSYGKRQIRNELKITKRGHIKRLLYAIRQIREPSNRERKIEEVKQNLKRVKFDATLDEHERKFWTKLIETSLKPQSYSFGSNMTLKEKLCELRNTWLMVFVLSNMLWLILITTLAEEGHLLNVFGSNPVGFVVVVLFGFILVIQFLAMMFHRFSTLKHYLARAPYLRGSGKNVIWDYDNKRDTQTNNGTGYQKLDNDISDVPGVD